MNIGFDAHVLDGFHQGTKTTITSLAEAVTSRGHRVALMRRDAERGHVITAKGPFGRFVQINAISKKRCFEWLVFQYIGIALFGKAVIFIHDVLPITHRKLFPLGFTVRCAVGFGLSTLLAAKVCCVSQYTLTETTRIFPWCRNKAYLVRNGPSFPIERYRIGHGSPNVQQRYILSVGRVELRKNFPLLIEAFRRAALPDVQLILVGSGEIKEPSEPIPGLRRLERLSDDELVEIYRGAALFVYPSQAEGFGLPLLDALLFGIATISSNQTAMSEVGGNLATYFDPTSPTAVDDLAKLIGAHFRGRPMYAPTHDERADLALKFSWESAAIAFERALLGRRGVSGVCVED